MGVMCTPKKHDVTMVMTTVKVGRLEAWRMMYACLQSSEERLYDSSWVCTPMNVDRTDDGAAATIPESGGRPSSSMDRSGDHTGRRDVAIPPKDGTTAEREGAADDERRGDRSALASDAVTNAMRGGPSHHRKRAELGSSHGVSDENPSVGGFSSICVFKTHILQKPTFAFSKHTFAFQKSNVSFAKDRFGFSNFTTTKKNQKNPSKIAKHKFQNTNFKISKDTF